MFNPQTTIPHATEWMLQTANKSVQRQRAQALDKNGNEHANKYWGERTTETADFVLGGEYTGVLSLPELKDGVTDWTLTYSETAFPTLSVSKDDAAGGGTFALPTGIQLPARTIGCPTAIPGIFSGLSGAKQITIACSCQHVEDTDGSGNYGTLNGMYDPSITVTITGIDGKPDVDFEEGWSEDSNAENSSNSAISGGSVVYSKHFAIA